MISLTRSVARQLGPFGITCNALAPQPSATRMMAYWDEERKAAMAAKIPVRRPEHPEGHVPPGPVPGLRRGGLHHRGDREHQRGLLHGLICGFLYAIHEMEEINCKKHINTLASFVQPWYK